MKKADVLADVYVQVEGSEISIADRYQSRQGFGGPHWAIIVDMPPNEELGLGAERIILRFTDRRSVEKFIWEIDAALKDLPGGEGFEESAKERS